MAINQKRNSKKKVVPGHYIIDWWPQGRAGKRERLEYVGTEVGARDYELELRRIAKPSARTIASPTFFDILPEFLGEYRNDVAESTIHDFHWAWKQLEGMFNKLPLHRLQPGMIENYKSQRLANGVKKRTINRELSYLSAIVKWAEEKKYLDPLPFRIKRFRKRDTKSPVPIVHTIDELHTILDHINPKRRGLVLLMYDAGLRRAEACTLKGSQVDLDTRQIRVIGKGSKERIVPIITERLHNELRIAKERAGKGYLWTNPHTKKPYKDIRTALRNAAERAGVDKRIYHHLLRHDHGTHTALAGVDPRAVQRIMGHSNLSTTELYTHLAGEYLASEGGKFAAILERRQSETKKSENNKDKSDP